MAECIPELGNKPVHKSMRRSNLTSETTRDCTGQYGNSGFANRLLRYWIKGTSRRVARQGRDREGNISDGS